MQNMRLVKASMSIKIHDEQVTRSKLIRTRNVTRTKLMRELGRNTKKYRTVIKGLRQAARDVKTSYKTAYEDKMVQLEVQVQRNRAGETGQDPSRDGGVHCIEYL